MNKIINSSWAVDASTITDSDKFKEVALRVCEDKDGWALRHDIHLFFIKNSKWVYGTKDELTTQQIITYNEFLSMFDNNKTNDMQTELMTTFMDAIVTVKLLYPDCVIKIEVSNLPIHEIGKAMNEENATTHSITDELPFNTGNTGKLLDSELYTPTGNKLIKIDATPEIRLISKPIKNS